MLDRVVFIIFVLAFIINIFAAFYFKSIDETDVAIWYLIWACIDYYVIDRLRNE